MQTILQELISELKSIESYDPIVQGIIRRAESKLETEKDHIMMAFNDGRVSGIFKEVKTADQYYKLTYKPETI
jgi:hypothetical protein